MLWASLFGVAMSAAAYAQNTVPGPTTKFVVTATGPQTAGALFTFTVQAQDANSQNTSYTGTVNFTSSDGSATLPAATTISGGLGTFSATLRLAGSQTISASDGSISGTSASITVDPGSAAALSFGVQPSNSVSATAFSPAPTVRVYDAFGNLRTTDSSTNVTLALGSNPGGGALVGTITLPVSNGVAQFTGISINKAGVGYTLTASSTGLFGDTSSAFNITAGTANKLAFKQQPTNTVSQATISTVTIEVQDAAGNLTNSTASVTVLFDNNAGSGTLSGTSTVSAVNGVATFSTLSIDKAGSGYKLGATSPSLTSANTANGSASSAFNVTVGAAAKLVYSQQPTNAVSAAAISPAVTVRIEDAAGNLTSSTANVTIAIANNAGTPAGTLSGLTTVAAVAGVATFSNLSIDKVGTAYTLSAVSSNLTSATSTPFDITEGAAFKLTFATQPSNGVANTNLTPAVTVRVEDSSGNLVTKSNAQVGIVIGTNPSGGQLSGGGTVPVSGGIATFSALQIDKVGTGYTLTAASGTLVSGTSSAFNIAVGAAAKLAIKVQPTSTVSTQTISPVTVEIQDTAGNLVSSSTANVTIAIKTPNTPGGTLSGTKTVAAVNGVATFSTLSIDQVGAYDLRATSTGLTSADTTPAFNITLGAAAKLAFTVQPVSTAATLSIPTMTVEILDAGGNLTASTQDVTIAIGNNAGSPSGTLSGTTTVSAVAGVATFSNLSIDKAGTGYTLAVTSSTPLSLTGATSAAFNITTGAAAKLAFGVQPTTTASNDTITPAVTVRILDAGGNLTSSGNSVTLTIKSGTGTVGAGLLGGSLTPASGGVATFSGLSIDLTGTGYQLNAASGSLTAATSSAFDITPNTATQLAFDVQPTGNKVAATAISPSVKVKILDAQGNLTSSTAMVTIAIANPDPNSRSGVLSGTTSRAAVAGVATFGDLSVDKVGTGYKLKATSTGLTQVTQSSSFDIIVGPAATMTVAADSTPQSAPISTSFAKALSVTVKDAGGNLVSGAPVTFTAPASGASGSFASNGLQTIVVSTTGSGVANAGQFNNNATVSAGSYNVTATTPGAGTSTVSASFSLTNAAATSFVARAYITNSNGTVSVIDTGTGQVVATVSAPSGDTGVAVSPNGGKVYVANNSANSVNVISTATNAVISTIGSITSPYGVAVHPDGSKVYVTSRISSGTVKVINTSTNIVSNTITVGTAPGGVAVTPDGAILLVANSGDNSVSVIDTATNLVVGTVTSVGTSPYGVAITSSGAKAYVTSAGGTSVAVIDKVATSPTVALVGVSSAQNGVAITGNKVFVALQNGYVEVIDATTDTIIPGARFGSGTSPHGVAVTSDGAKVYFANNGNNNVAVFATGTYAPVGSTIPVGSGPVALGKFIGPNVATKFAVTATGPRTAGTSFSFTVQALDSQNVATTGYTGTVNFTSSDPDAILPSNTTLTNGFGTFNATLRTAGVQTITATDTVTASVTGTSGNVTVNPGAATKFSIAAVSPQTAGTAFNITVIARDANENIDTTYSSQVTITSSDVSATLPAQPQLTNGVGTFPVTLFTAGSRTITATASGPIVGTSNVTVNPAAGAVLDFAVQPTNTVSSVNFAPSPTVRVLDAFGNLASGSTNVTLAIAPGTGPVGATLAGTATVASVNGVATFSGLSIAKAGTAYQLAATAAGLTSATSAAFNIATGPATQVAFGTQPSNASSGATISPAVTVRLLDAGGNLTNSTANVTLAIGNNAGPGGVLSGTTTVAAVNGVATFSTLSINKKGNGYTLAASSAGLTTATSSAFNITAGILAVQPARGTTSGGTFVTITGANLAGATAASVGGVPLTSFTAVNATTVTGYTGAHAAGTADVVVTIPTGASTGTDFFTYVAPGTLRAYSVVLDGPSESPPNVSPGTGTATVVVNTVAKTMSITTTFSGLTGTTTSAHIHAATATPATGAAGSATQSPTFSGFPVGVSNGTYTNTFDMTQAASFDPAFLTANGGTAAAAFAALADAIDGGKSYLNIHSSTFSGGEIRGFLVPAPAPTVTSSTLAIAANSSTLTIGGAGFDGVTPANNTVTLDDGATGTVTAATATSLTVSFGTKPVAAGPLSAVVVNGGGSSGAAVQVATVVPVVTASTSNVPVTTTSLTINGFGFSTTEASNSVTLSSGSATVTGATNTQLTVSVSGLSLGALTAQVTSNGQSSGAAVQVATLVVGPPSTMAVNPGSTPQTATFSTAFAMPLAVTVRDGANNPVSGVDVTFTAPLSGASAVFSNSLPAITVTSNASGVASAAVSANATAGGPYTVTASATGVANVSFSLTNAKANQTIAFTSTAPTNATSGGVYTAAATATSGLTVVFTSGSPACTVTGSTVRFVAVGTCTINANQSGNSNYNGASQVQQSIAVKSGSTHDFDGDGKSDILWRGPNGEVAIWIMNGATIASGPLVSPAPLTWTIAGTGDFDGDGKADILWRGPAGEVAIWFMNGATRTSGPVVGGAPLGWTIAGTGDFDGDGKSDILWRGPTNEVAVWFMNGGTVVNTPQVGAIDTTWTISGTGDFNRDGKADILWRHTSGAVALWMMNGATVTSGSFVAMAPTNWTIKGTGDFDGDGSADILWRGPTGEVAVWLMNGATLTSGPLVGSAPLTWTISGTGDFNADLKSDVVWRGPNGEVALWLLNGATLTAGPVVDRAPLTWTIQKMAGN